MHLVKSRKDLPPEGIRTLFRSLLGGRKPKVKGPVQPPQPGSSIYIKRAGKNQGY